MFLYYDRLEGVEAHTVRARRARLGRPAGPEQHPGDLGPEAPSLAEEPARDVNSLAVLVARTVAGLQGSEPGPPLPRRVRIQPRRPSLLQPRRLRPTDGERRSRDPWVDRRG